MFCPVEDPRRVMDRMFKRLVMLVPVAMGLMSCLSQQADLGNRVISVDAGAIPASATISSSMEGLVAETNPELCHPDHQRQ
jgi:hypothetical protein